MLVAFVAYGFSRCVSYISYVSNFGLMNQPHGYVSTIPFMAGASVGVVLASLIILLGYITGRLHVRSLPYKVPFLVIVLVYSSTLLFPEAFEGEIALATLGLIWGLATTYTSAAAIEFILYETSPVLIIACLACASLLTAALSILLKMYPLLAGPLDIVLAIVSLLLIRSLRRKPWPDIPLNAPRDTFRKTLRLSAGPILASAVFELVVGLINMFSFTGASSFQIEADSPIVGMLISGVIVTVFVITVRRVPQEQVIYSVIYPAIIGLILLVPFFGSVFGKATSALLYSAYLFTSMLSMFCCIRACQKTHDSIYGVISVFSLALRLLLVVGLSLGWWLGTLQDAENFMNISLACVICIYFLGLVLVIRNASKKFKFQQDITEENTESVVPKNTSYSFSYAVSAEFQEAHMSEAHAEQEKVRIADCENKLEPNALENTAQSVVESRLDELVHAYGLTNRERDVLAGLAQGNTAASIATDLCLSTSTVQSYTKTLYAKLGLNKKQQVIDLVMKGKDR